MYYGVLKTGVLWLTAVGLNEWLSEAAAYLTDAAVPGRLRVLIDGLLLGVAGRVAAGVTVDTGSRRPFATHMVFALHFYAFQLLLLCALLIGTVIGGWFYDSDKLSRGVDIALFGVQLCLSAVYLHIAIYNAYGVRGFRRAATVAALIVSAGCAVLGYRFFIFVITLYGT